MSKNSIRLTVGDIMRIAHWMETYRDPDRQPQYITIEVTDTGIGPIVEAFIETKPGEGAWKDFTAMDSW